MAASNYFRFLLPHLFAAAISTVLFITVPVVVVLIVIIIDNDPGGPMFFPMFLGLTVLIAFGACTLCFALSVSLQFLQRLRPFPHWLPIISAFPVACIVLLLFGFPPEKTLTAWLLWSAVLSTAFCAYWTSLIAVQAMLSRSH